VLASISSFDIVTVGYCLLQLLKWAIDDVYSMCWCVQLNKGGQSTVDIVLCRPVAWLPCGGGGTKITLCICHLQVISGHLTYLGYLWVGLPSAFSHSHYHSPVYSIFSLLFQKTRRDVRTLFTSEVSKTSIRWTRAQVSQVPLRVSTFTPASTHYFTSVSRILMEDCIRKLTISFNCASHHIYRIICRIGVVSRRQERHLSQDIERHNNFAFGAYSWFEFQRNIDDWYQHELNTSNLYLLLTQMPSSPSLAYTLKTRVPQGYSGVAKYP
jgi:hypothetical protein